MKNLYTLLIALSLAFSASAQVDRSKLPKAGPAKEIHDVMDVRPPEIGLGEPDGVQLVGDGLPSGRISGCCGNAQAHRDRGDGFV